MSEAVIALDGIGLRFGGLVVLEGISLAVARGELFAIVGPNGAGKTSLLNCISGLYRPTQGRLQHRGDDITRMAPHAIASRGIARTFQHMELYPQMSVLQNLMLGRHRFRRYGLLSAAVWAGHCSARELAERERVEAVIEFFELESVRKAPVGDLPYGIQKIVSLARAFASDPEVVLLDEPSAGLNRQEKEDLARFVLRARHDMAPTLIWIEHDMQLVRDLADRVIVLHYGKELVTGTPQAVLSDPRVIEAYLGKHGGVRTAAQAD